MGVDSYLIAESHVVTKILSCLNILLLYNMCKLQIEKML